ncbi:MAG: sugar ABC transporter permease [Alphaproteobacteria bacterium]|nr:sugar ABC transporter permease [Alphaproteobacteria bacterium]
MVSDGSVETLPVAPRVAQPVTPPAIMSERLRGLLTGYALTGPALFLMLLMLIGPVIMVALMSFTDYSLGEMDWSFVGLDNYRDLADSEDFWKSLRNTLVYVGVVVPVSVGLGLGVAILIEGCGAWKAFYRAVYFLPVMATLIAMAIVWLVVLNQDFGLVNLLLKQFGIRGPNWLNDPATALLSLGVIGVWQALGFNMVLFMAGLTAIPHDLYDAAELDGAGGAWDRFRTVTWPMLGPVTMFVLVITTIRSFQVFDTVHVLTGGGPNKATEVLIYSIYTEGFEFFRTSHAAALTVIFLAFIFLLTFINARIIERRVHYT